MKIESHVGPAAAPDNIDVTLRSGYQGDLISTPLNGKYQEQLLRGNVFVYTVTTAAAIIIAATTGLHPTIWNPSDSGKIFVPIRLSISWLSGTTTVGSTLWAVTKNAGANISATAPIITFTRVAAENALVGAGKTSKMYWAPTTNTFVAIPTVFMATGINMGAAFPTVGNPAVVDYEGHWGLMPGNAMSLTYSVTTSTGLFFTTIYGMELPLPQYA